MEQGSEACGRCGSVASEEEVAIVYEVLTLCNDLHVVVLIDKAGSGMPRQMLAQPRPEVLAEGLLQFKLCE